MCGWLAIAPASADLRSAGAEIVDQLAFPEEPAGLADAAYEVLLHEFNLRHAEAELKWFQQEIFLQAQARGDLQSPAYLDALALTRDFGRWQAAVAPE